MEDILDRILGHDKLKGAKELKIELEDEIESLVDAAKSTTLSDNQRGKFHRLSSDLEKLNSHIEQLEGKQRQSMNKASRIMRNNGLDNEERPSFSFSNFDSDNNFYIQKKTIAQHGPISDWVARNFTVNEDELKCDFGKVLLALTSSKPQDRITENVVGALKSVSGSATLTEFLSAKLWEAGISKSHLANSGMQTFLMDEPTVRFPKITEYPVMQWMTENAQSTERAITIGSVDGTARTIRGFVNISGELMQDGHGVEKAIRRAFSVATANGIDEGGLYGDNSAPDPRGINSYTNVNRLDLLGTPIADYDPFLNAGKLILDDDGEFPNTSIMSPDNWIALQLIKTATEEMPMPRPEVLKNHNFLESTKVEFSEIFMGGFSSLHLGVRLNTQIVISPVLSDTFQHNILCVARGQFFPEREQDFAIIENITIT